jgi:hypothetical protein
VFRAISFLVLKCGMYGVPYRAGTQTDPELLCPYAEITIGPWPCDWTLAVRLDPGRAIGPWPCWVQYGSTGPYLVHLERQHF